MAAATSHARSVDQYRDTSLDGLIGPDNNNPTRGSSQRRDGSQRRSYFADDANMPANLPEAPEVPRGPPISYRSTSQDAQVPQRSFSQRAKARPYLKEAINDDEIMNHGYDAYPVEPLANSGSQYSDAHPRRQGGGGAEPLHLNTAVGSGKSTRSAAPQITSPTETPQTARSSKPQKRRQRRTSDTPQFADEPASAETRAVPQMRTEEDRRDWASDRSPLQKLEVTLNDISKEEKRARVEEAEMLLRAAKAGRGGRGSGREITPTTPKTTAPLRQSSNRASERKDLEEAGLVRSLSSSQRDRLQQSTSIPSRKPDANRLSGDGRRGFDYEEQEYAGQRNIPPTGISEMTSPPAVSNGSAPADYPEADLRSRKREPSRREKAAVESSPVVAHQFDQESTISPLRNSIQETPRGSRQVQNLPQSERSPDMNTRFPQHNPVWQTNSQSAAHSVPSNITRAVSMQAQKPPTRFRDDQELARSITINNEDSSRTGAPAVAAIAGPLAMAAEVPVARSNSRKLQKAPPPGYQRPLAGPDQTARAVEPGDGRVRSDLTQDAPQRVRGTAITQSYLTGAPRQATIQRDDSKRNKKQSGSVLQDASPITSNRDKPLPPAPNTDSPPRPQFQSQRPRQQSVSFKEPFDRPRPIDEWRQAGVARLSLPDFALDQPANNATRDKAWWEAQKSSSTRRKNRRSSNSRAVPDSNNEAFIDDRVAEFKPPLYLKCGPLLRYKGMKRTRSDHTEAASAHDQEIWRGSVMIVTQDSRSSYESVPTLRLFSQPKRLLPPPPQRIAGEELAPEYVDPIAGLTKLSRTGKALYVRPVDHLEEEKDLSGIEDDNGLFEASPSPLDVDGSKEATVAVTNKRTIDQDGERMGKFQEVKGVRLYADPLRGVTFWRFNLEVELGERQEHIAYRINRGPSIGFWVPARGQSMNIMFHSCNGFSLSVTPDHFSGPDPLWRDVLNVHQTSPFHVMLGGGDQIYNDRVTLETKHFAEWTKMRNPHHKHHAPFTPEMKEELETFYLDRYSMWFSQGLFGMANCQIPMVNIWDDHDIIDGFGSYPDQFMRSAVFCGVGNIAFKYYMLFQHQSVPEETTSDEPSWVLGAQPGPYITQKSRSVFMLLGRQIAFLGLDCRTERKRTDILTDETYDIVLQRCRKEIIEGETKHLIVLLGVPIAYPRLVWLENVLTSRAMDPIKALGRYGVIKTGFLNKFDGGVEILDDLDDHWTATHHKAERNMFIEELQDLAAEKSVRISILGGDVHLAAIGQFYSNPKLRIPKDKDHRYMPNIISSAIVNTPPPDIMPDMINKRNKVHHFDKYTDEDMIPMFTHDIDDKKRNNKHLLPRRNWCSIREYQPGSTPPPSPPSTPSMSDEEVNIVKPQRRFSFSREDMDPRKLIRRISQRGAPPSSFRSNMDFNRSSSQGDFNRPTSQGSYDGQARPTTHNPDCPIHGENGHHSQSALPHQRTTSFDSARPSLRPASFEHSSAGAPVRPGMFKRRPTNLSEKAARKGIMPALDAEGNEVDVNDHINLEGGLDIILNVEINQKDPAGATVPYRLLVPALWYDGSSDREKLDDPHTSGFQRKPTLFKKFGLRNNTASKSGNSQEDGHLDNDTSDEGYSEGEDGQAHSRPRRLFGLFGSRRRREDDDDEYQDDAENQHQHQTDGNNQGSDQLFDSQNHPPPRHPASTNNRGSYVIGSAHQGEEGQSHAIQRNPRQPQPEDLDNYQEQQPNVNRQRSSKQDRVLGVGSERDRFQQPEQTQLRGNGIIGHNYHEQTGGHSSSRFSDDEPNQHSRGYSGVEAYREPKGRSRWSFRGARDWAREGTKWE